MFPVSCFIHQYDTVPSAFTPIARDAPEPVMSVVVPVDRGTPVNFSKTNSETPDGKSFPAVKKPRQIPIPEQQSSFREKE
jgi:hypothetical protein